MQAVLRRGGIALPLAASACMRMASTSGGGHWGKFFDQNAADKPAAPSVKPAAAAAPAPPPPSTKPASQALTVAGAYCLCGLFVYCRVFCQLSCFFFFVACVCGPPNGRSGIVHLRSIPLCVVATLVPRVSRSGGGVLVRSYVVIFG